MRYGKNTSKKNISKIFMQAKENMQTQSASKSWENALNTIQTNLKPEDIEIIKNLSKMLRNFRCRWTN